MEQTSVKDQIKKLVDLQKIDGEIYDLKVELKEKPARVAELKEEFEATKSRLHELEEKLKGVQVERKDLELELKSKEEAMTKANTTLSELKTNKEYSARISEIESMKADKSVLEEKILGSYDRSDAVQKDIDVEKGKVAEEEKVYLAKKKEVEEDVQKIEQRIKDLDAQRQEIVPGVNPNTLALYNRILERKEGIAIASARGASCGGCHMNVTAQMINQLKLYEEFVQCEFCNRILYLEDDL